MYVILFYMNSLVAKLSEGKKVNMEKSPKNRQHPGQKETQKRQTKQI